MAGPGNRLQTLLLDGLSALDAKPEFAIFVAAQGGLHEEEKIAGAARLLKQKLFGVTTIGFIGHVLRAEVVGIPTVELGPHDSRQQFALFIEQPLFIRFNDSLCHRPAIQKF